MKTYMLSIAAGALALVSLAGAGLAQDGTPLTARQAAETQSRLKLAAGVITLGRADKNPMMMIVGAKILSGLGAVGGEGNASTAYDLATVVEEAKALADGNEYLLGEIAAIQMPSSQARAARYCNWYENCGYSIVDPFACEMVQVCN